MLLWDMKVSGICAEFTLWQSTFCGVKCDPTLPSPFKRLSGYTFMSELDLVVAKIQLYMENLAYY